VRTWSSLSATYGQYTPLGLIDRAGQDCATFGSKMCTGNEGDPLDGGTLGVCVP
jgi:hypothetical protein